MYYKLKVVKYQENPKYDAEKAQWDDQVKRKYGYDCGTDISMPEKLVATNYVDVVLTEEQYKAVQKAVLEQFN